MECCTLTTKDSFVRHRVLLRLQPRPRPLLLLASLLGKVEKEASILLSFFCLFRVYLSPVVIQQLTFTRRKLLIVHTLLHHSRSRSIGKRETYMNFLVLLLLCVYNQVESHRAQRNTLFFLKEEIYQSSSISFLSPTNNYLWFCHCPSSTFLSSQLFKPSSQLVTVLLRHRPYNKPLFDLYVMVSSQKKKKLYTGAQSFLSSAPFLDKDFLGTLGQERRSHRNRHF